MVFHVIAAIVIARLAVDPIAPYDSNGAAYIEHSHRVGTAAALQARFAQEEGSTSSLITRPRTRCCGGTCARR